MCLSKISFDKGLEEKKCENQVEVAKTDTRIVTKNRHGTARTTLGVGVGRWTERGRS